MNLDSLSFTLSQISYLVTNLNKKNFEESCEAISSVSIYNSFVSDKFLFESVIPLMGISLGRELYSMREFAIRG